MLEGRMCRKVPNDKVWKDTNDKYMNVSEAGHEQLPLNSTSSPFH